MKQNKQLLPLAILTSPLFGTFTVAPIILYLSSRPAEELDYIDMYFIKTVGIVLAVCAVYLFQWFLNIALLNFQQDRKNNSFLSSNWQRYLLSFAITLGLSSLFIIASDEYSFGINVFKYYPLLGNFVTNSFILILIDLTISRKISENLKLEKAQLEISQLITQQEQLKQQIHPHFLFNAIGTLQILIGKEPERALVYSKRLASFLRDSLSLAQNDVVPVEQELAFLENYLLLQQMRFSSSITYDITIPEAVKKEAKLPVFSLQLLAENAIKHTSFSKEEPLQITIEYLPEGFLLMKNNKNAKYSSAESNGIGLKNLAKRFGHFTEELPQIIDTEEHFGVKLKVLGK